MRSLVDNAAMRLTVFVLSAFIGLAPCFGGGSMLLLGTGSGGGSSYTGPGDVVSGAFAAYSLRAYNAADRGNKLINICDPANVTCADWSSSATTGKLVAGTNPLNGTDCTTATTCTVKIWYDRSGATNCGGSVCDASQATAANRPTLTFSCLNGLPCLVFNGSQFLSSTATISAFAATATFSSVSERTANPTFTQLIMAIEAATGVGPFVNYRAVVNTIQMFAGITGQTVGNITDSNFHALQAAFNGASSTLMCGGSAGTNCSTVGTSNSISPGTTGSASSANLCIGSEPSLGSCESSGVTLFGNISEALAYSSTFSGTQQTNMNANQYAFWGPF